MLLINRKLNVDYNYVQLQLLFCDPLRTIAWNLTMIFKQQQQQQQKLVKNVGFFLTFFGKIQQLLHKRSQKSNFEVIAHYISFLPHSKTINNTKKTVAIW